MKMTAYPAITSFEEDSILLTDGDTTGTKKISALDAFLSMMHNVSPENHRRLFRGKNLGSNVTDEQLNAIKNGTFEDLWLGDYWEDGNGVRWRIVDFDYYYNAGDNADGYYNDHTKHHLVIMPDTAIYSDKFCNSNSTVGGYYGSVLASSIVSSMKSKSLVESVFGDAIYQFREYFTNKVDATNGYPNGGDWCWSGEFVIPNEIMMFGCHIFAPASDGSIDVSRYTTSKTQLALFNVCPKFINIRQEYWLRDVANKARFAFVSEHGEASYTNASNSRGVRPYFLIG